MSVKATLDSASLYGAVAALHKGQPRSWSPWDRYTIAHVTLGLLLHDDLRVHAGGKPATGLYGDVLKELGNIATPALDSDAYRAAVGSTSDWSVQHAPFLNEALPSAKSDASFDAWLDWSRREAWLEHVRRLGSLVDQQMWWAVGKVLGFSEASARSLYRACSNTNNVRQWARLGHPPEEVVDAYTLSALLRGHLNMELASQQSAQYAFHPLRDYVLGAVPDFRGCAIPGSASALACVLVSSALKQRSSAQSTLRWAENVRKVRVAVQAGELKFPDE